ncbi:MAG: iron ABC transporter permease, partial [Atribacterota bacterium]|nr:iron ABC transporter permease [Atribacterota bacterium]
MMNSSRNRQFHEIAGQLRLIWKEPILFVFIILIFYFLFTFVAYPLFQVIKYSIFIDGQWDFSNYLAIFSKRYYFQPFINSIILGICTATIGTIAGFIFAYALTRTPLPFKSFFRLTATFPIISPPFVVALAAIL